MNPEELKQAAYAMAPWLSAVRRDLHMHPELGGEEFRTSRAVQENLRQMGVEFYVPEGSTAVVGTVRGALPGRTVAIRADMDALPITEENDVSYRSQNEGVMHACGHDAHTAILLGTAKLFAALRESLHGNIRLLFQPAEETTGGAEKMVAEGCMKSPDADYVIGLHVTEGLESGTVEVPYHAVNGASDMYTIIIQGAQAHGAHPEKGRDAVVIAAQVITALQTIVSRGVSPVDSAVFTIGSIHGGTKRNIIADEVIMEGILRTISPETRVFARRRVKEIAEGISTALGGSAEVLLQESYKALINRTEVADTVKDAATELLGAEHVTVCDVPSLGVDDFAYLLDAAPGAYYHLGCANASKGITAPAHSSRFDIDEACLPVGVLIHAAAALRLLEQGA